MVVMDTNMMSMGMVSNMAKINMDTNIVSNMVNVDTNIISVSMDTNIVSNKVNDDYGYIDMDIHLILLRIGTYILLS
ncbi:hypothetical protein CEXT_644701 [Caerostris extrusa]|uniref:Uncharacterized protein n=1 Tax=Caerostris extrusa TaxID=172846 RepID=A0AAV4XPF9_CAEEX|nr:hypothetical protein CEXT_644701 [Caerostris extrusa]